VTANTSTTAVKSAERPLRESTPKEVSPPSLAAERLISLDALRGFIMFWIIGGAGLVEGLQALGSNSIVDTIAYELHHSPWQGLRFYDCIWPCFMLMVGVSLAFSFSRRSLTQTHHEMTLHALKRAAVIFLLGSLRESVSTRYSSHGAPYLIEQGSAIQPIAIAYLMAFLLVRKSPRFQLTVAAIILGGYALLLALVPVPSIPAATYAFNPVPRITSGPYAYIHNLVFAVDRRILGNRADPVYGGTILSILPSIATTIIGLLVGEVLISPRPKESKLRRIGALGILCMALGFAISPFMPPILDLWTTSYGLLTAGWACLMLLAFYWIIDIRGYKKWSFPLRVIGMNAIFIYMFTSLCPISQTVGIFTSGIANKLGSLGPLFMTFSVVLVEWLILFWMYRRRIFIRA